MQHRCAQDLRVLRCNTHRATHTEQHTQSVTLQHTQSNTHRATHTECNVATHAEQHTQSNTHRVLRCNTHRATHTEQHTVLRCNTHFENKVARVCSQREGADCEIQLAACSGLLHSEDPLFILTHRHINTSTHQHINTSSHHHINTSTHHHITTSPHQHINTRRPGLITLILLATLSRPIVGCDDLCDYKLLC